jgi:hypothetical protein
LAPDGSFLAESMFEVKILRSSQTGKLLLQKMPSVFLLLGVASREVLFRLMEYPFLANSA